MLKEKKRKKKTGQVFSFHTALGHLVNKVGHSSTFLAKEI